MALILFQHLFALLGHKVQPLCITLCRGESITIKAHSHYCIFRVRLRQMVALLCRDRKIPISALTQSTAESADRCGECEWALRLTSSLTGVDSTKQLKLMLIQQKQSSWIQTKWTGGHPAVQWYFPLSLCSLLRTHDKKIITVRKQCPGLTSSASRIS